MIYERPKVTPPVYLQDDGAPKMVPKGPLDESPAEWIKAPRGGFKPREVH